MKDTILDWQKLGILERYKYDYIKHILLYTSMVCPNVLEGNYLQDLADSLQINVEQELQGDKIPEETKDIIRKMTKE